MVMEYWSGWFDLWGNLHHVYTAEGKAYFAFATVRNTYDGVDRFVFSETYGIPDKSVYMRLRQDFY